MSQRGGVGSGTMSRAPAKPQTHAEQPGAFDKWIGSYTDWTHGTGHDQRPHVGGSSIVPVNEDIAEEHARQDRELGLGQAHRNFPTSPLTKHELKRRGRLPNARPVGAAYKLSSVCILGAPGSGKTTQAQLVANKYGLVVVSANELVRLEVDASTTRGLKAKPYLNNGQLVPDEILIHLVITRLNQTDVASSGWVLDGFPQTPSQADALIKAGFQPDRVIILDTPEGECVDRVLGRRMDPNTGEIYHAVFRVPADGVRNRVVRRSEDTEPNTRSLVHLFNQQVDKLCTIYKDVLRRVDGNRPSDLVIKEMDVFLSARNINADMEDSGVDNEQISSRTGRKMAQVDDARGEYKKIVGGADNQRKQIGSRGNETAEHAVAHWLRQGDAQEIEDFQLNKWDQVNVCETRFRSVYYRRPAPGLKYDPRKIPTVKSDADLIDTDHCYGNVLRPSLAINEKGEYVPMSEFVPAPTGTKTALGNAFAFIGKDGMAEPIVEWEQPVAAHDPVDDPYAPGPLEKTVMPFPNKSMVAQAGPPVPRLTHAKVRLRSVIVLGPPLCGKDRICAHIADKYNLKLLNVADLLRDEVEAGTHLGKRLKATMEFGSITVPDHFIVDLIVERLSQPDCHNGWLMDGFPLTATQAEGLLAHNIKPEKVVVIEAQDEDVLERAKATLDPEESAKVTSRLAAYRGSIDDVIDFYHTTVQKIDSNGSAEDVNTAVDEYLTVVKGSVADKQRILAAKKGNGVIVVGPPASGKTTISTGLRDHAGMVYVSVPDLIKEEVESGSAVGLNAEEFLQRGELVPDDIVNFVVSERINSDDCRMKGWVLDGYPRTRQQADMLAESGVMPDKFVLLKLYDNVVIERVTGRRFDPSTGRVYHIESNPAPEAVRDRVIQRLDDTEENVKPRIASFKTKIDGVVGKYLGCYKKFDASRPIQKVFEQVHRYVISADEASEAQRAEEAKNSAKACRERLTMDDMLVPDEAAIVAVSDFSAVEKQRQDAQEKFGSQFENQDFVNYKPGGDQPFVDPMGVRTKSRQKIVEHVERKAMTQGRTATMGERVGAIDDRQAEGQILRDVLKDKGRLELGPKLLKDNTNTIEELEEQPSFHPKVPTRKLPAQKAKRDPKVGVWLEHLDTVTAPTQSQQLSTRQIKESLKDKEVNVPGRRGVVSNRTVFTAPGSLAYPQ